MKSKKKVGLIKRIAAGVCAVILAVSCLGSVPYYANEYSSVDLYGCTFGEYKEFLSLYLGCSSSDSYLNNFANASYETFVEDDYTGIFTKFYWNPYDTFWYFPVELSSGYVGVCFGEYSTSASTNYLYLCTSEKPIKKPETSICMRFEAGTSTAVFGGSIYGASASVIEDYESFIVVNGKFYDLKEICSFAENTTTSVDYGNIVFFSDLGVSEEVYNSSLGYLQDIKRQFIYLEDDAFDLVEDTAACKFTFANTTTSGLDITDGNWSIRHYMQIEVKNAKKEYETVDVYDKVYLNEYAAADGKIIYQQKDTVERLHEESGFDGLSWWESNFLGYITYYNDYFQLVRTNEDGSVEYGGYVKVWQDEYNINHSTTLGEDESQDNSGYNDNIVSGSHGSGGTYEEAEKDADENAANSSTSNGEALAELDNILSTISAVPEAFSRMFGFLPDWCLNSIGIAIVAGVAIIIWKTGRG